MADPYIGNVEFLLHLEGADNSTALVDTGPKSYGFTQTANSEIAVDSTLVIKTAQSKIGSSSLYFTDVNAYAICASGATAGSIVNPSGVIGATANFTFEFWAYRDGRFTNGGVFDLYDACIFSYAARKTGAGGFSTGTLKIWGQDTTLKFGGYFQDGVGNTQLITVSALNALPANTWKNIVCQRSGNNLQIYVDGVLTTNTSLGTYVNFYQQTADGNNYNALGKPRPGSSQWPLLGYIDEVRFTIGTARYSANFTPSLVPFDDAVVLNARALESAGPLSTAIQIQSTLRGEASALMQKNILETIANSNLLALVDTLNSPMGSLVYAQSSSPLSTDVQVAIKAFFHSAVLVDSPLTLATKYVSVRNDFLEILSKNYDITYLFEAEFMAPSGTVKLPISSWQATLQNEASCYGQCVVPQAQAYKTLLDSVTEFRIYRVAYVQGFDTFNQQVFATDVETRTYDIGPTNYTCTLSGYFDKFGLDTNPSAGYNRTLKGVRSVSINNSKFRVRSDLDWFLRPSERAIVDDYDFIVSYINYYVNLSDSYMDVGER